jgi:hypothetical protein
MSYETFFAAITIWVALIDILKPAYTLAGQYGLGALDALYVTAAERAGAELVSAERPTKPLTAPTSAPLQSTEFLELLCVRQIILSGRRFAVCALLASALGFSIDEK